MHYRITADLQPPSAVSKEDIQEHFKAHGAGNITEVKLMNGFGFVEYDDPMDARDVVPGLFESSFADLCTSADLTTTAFRKINLHNTAMRKVY